MPPIFMHMFQAAKLDPQFYDQLKTRVDLHRQSIWVMAIYLMMASMGIMWQGGGKAVNAYLGCALIAWYVWAFTVFYVSKRFIATESNLDRKAVMRVMGFATAPGVLGILGIIPNLTGPVWVLMSAWMVTAASIGLQRILGQATVGPSAMVCFISWLLATTVQGVFLVTATSIFPPS